VAGEQAPEDVFDPAFGFAGEFDFDGAAAGPAVGGGGEDDGVREVVAPAAGGLGEGVAGTPLLRRLAPGGSRGGTPLHRLPSSPGRRVGVEPIHRPGWEAASLTLRSRPIGIGGG